MTQATRMISVWSVDIRPYEDPIEEVTITSVYVVADSGKEVRKKVTEAGFEPIATGWQLDAIA